MPIDRETIIATRHVSVGAVFTVTAVRNDGPTVSYYTLRVGNTEFPGHRTALLCICLDRTAAIVKLDAATRILSTLDFDLLKEIESVHKHAATKLEDTSWNK